MVAVQIEVVMYANYRGIPPAFPFYSSFDGAHRSSTAHQSLCSALSNYIIHSSAPSMIHIVVHRIVEHRFPAEQIGLICIKRALAESLSGKWAGNLIRPLLRTSANHEAVVSLQVIISLIPSQKVQCVLH